MTNAHVATRIPLPVAAPAPVMTPGLERLFAVAIGVIVLPLYAPQPLVDLIGPSLGFSLRTASLVAMTSMLGYAAGLVLLVPLIDVIENRRAILSMLLVDFVALASAAAAPTPGLFLLAAFAAGCATSTIQMLVPVAAGLVGEAHRGRIIGNVMNGPMIGILLSRPIASLAAAAIGWRGAYALDAVAVAAIAVALNRVVPRQQPVAGETYAALITSLWMLHVGQPVVRRRALYQALCMGAFGIFWMAIGLRLSATPFELDRVGIALFALTGIGGAVIAPVAGWAGDRGWTTPATRLAHAAVIAAFVLAGAAGAGWFGFDPTARPRLAARPACRRSNRARSRGDRRSNPRAPRCQPDLPAGAWPTERPLHRPLLYRWRWRFCVGGKRVGGGGMDTRLPDRPGLRRRSPGARVDLTVHRR